MASETLSVAVIGCGAQGGAHLSAYQQQTGVRIAAICDTDLERLETASRNVPTTHRYTDFRSLLASQRFDLVSICTMPESHREIATAALAAGANVICEKPTAMNLTDAEAMFAAAHAAGRFLTIGFNMRFLPSAQRLKQWVEDGGLGQVAYTHAWAHEVQIPWWGKHYEKRIAGGGVLASTAVHVLDLALWIAGSPEFITASASMTQLFPRKRGCTAPTPNAAERFDVEDAFSGHIRFADGTWMSLDASWTWDDTADSHSFEMIGEASTIRLDPLRITVERNGMPVDAFLGADEGASSARRWQQSIEAEVADALDAVREGREPLVRPVEALRVQSLVDALYESTATNREVRNVSYDH